MKVAKFLTKIFILIGILFSTTISAFGDSNVFGSLSIYAHISNDEGEVINLSDVEFSLVKVADYVDGQWIHCDGFKDTIDFSMDMSASSRNKYAKKLYSFVNENNISFEDEQSTDDAGRLLFNHLEEGLYLIVQKEKIENEIDVYSSDPFLIPIPFHQGTNYVYDMEVEPKIKITTKTQEDNQIDNKEDAVSTNDQSNANFWQCLLLISLFVIIVSYRNKKVQN